MKGLFARSEDDSGFVDAILQIDKTKFSQFALLAVIIYDIVISLDREVKYFWVLPLSDVNVAYFLIRYSAVFRGIVSIMLFSLNNSDRLCNFESWSVALSDWLILVCIDYVLYLRVRALYSLGRKRKTMRLCLKAFFIAESAITFGVNLHLTILSKVNAQSIVGTKTYCASHGRSDAEFSVMWSSILAYQFVLTILSVIKALKFKGSLGSRGIRLVKVLVQDQVLYFVLVLLSSLTSVLGVLLPGIFDSIAMYIFWYVAGSTVNLSLIGSRMLLHLKQTAEDGPNEGRNLRTLTHGIVGATTDVFRTISATSERDFEDGNDARSRSATNCHPNFQEVPEV